MNIDPFTIWWIKAATYAAFAAFGGAMGHLVRSIHNNQKISWSKTIIESFSAGFVGVLVLFACQAMHLSEQWTGVIVGVCGWLGATATIALLENVVRKKLGIEGARDDQPSSSNS